MRNQSYSINCLCSAIRWENIVFLCILDSNLAHAYDSVVEESFTLAFIRVNLYLMVMLHMAKIVMLHHVWALLEEKILFNLTKRGTAARIDNGWWKGFIATNLWKKLKASSTLITFLRDPRAGFYLLRLEYHYPVRKRVDSCIQLMAKLCSLVIILSASLFLKFLACLATSRKNMSTDESALLALKSSITLDPYLMVNNWSTSSSICNWVGVTCDGFHGRVKALNLSNMALQGTISPQFGNLSFLVELDLQGNSFYGELPQQFFLLHRLKLLDLSNNHFVGQISSGIGHLSELQYLNLGSNNFTGFIPQSISNLSYLEYLNCSLNFLSGTLPPAIGQLRRLKILELRNNTLSGTIPHTVSNLSSLEDIRLSYNSFSGEIPKGIGDLPLLRRINAEYNQLSGNIPSTIFNSSLLQHLNLGQNNLSATLPSNICEGLPKLRLLYLYNNGFSGEIPTVWHQCNELEDLELSFNSFNKGRIPAGIGNLTNLQYLYLYSNNLQGEIPFSLFNISSLREVELQKNNLNGSLPRKMCNRLPQLDYFALRGNQIEGSIPRSIGNCTVLNVLYLGDNNFTGSIPMEIGNLDQLVFLALGNNRLSGPIPSELFNISTLSILYLARNSLSGIIPSDMGSALPNLQEVYIYANKLVGSIPNGISNASKLTAFDFSDNQFSGIIPNVFGDLTLLQWLGLAVNNLTTDDSNEFTLLNSLTSCRYLTYLDVSKNSLLTRLPKSIGNLSNSLEYFMADACGIHGNVPLEIGNITNLVRLSLNWNDINGTLPATIKELHSLQFLGLDSNTLHGSIIDELCEMRTLSELYLPNNKLSGALPQCLGNMTSLRKLYMGSNKLNSEIPPSFWSLVDILEVNLSSNAISGNLPPEIGHLRAIVLLDLSRNEISSNIPPTISFLKTLQNLSLAHNKLEGAIPESLGQMVSLNFLDLSQNLLSGVIPKSLESLANLQYINFSYNRLQGEIPTGGPFTNFTAQSFMHNDALCGDPRLKVPPCGKQVRRRSKKKLLLIKFMVPIIVSIILVVACIIVLQRKRKNTENPVERDLSTLGVPRRISYYELVQASGGFGESNLLGKGSFGSVYQGILSGGMMVAIKVFDLDKESISGSFETECNALRNLRHRNLVKIISSCSNVDFKSLVMELMSNGSVDKWLYSDNYCLDVLQRLNIMIDVACALEYLHHGSSMPVVHCDLKPSNVLLDENMVAHVSDFGIAKLLDEGQSKTLTQTLATLGYVAPEYGSKGIVSIKGDVYSYGIMLMEIFTRKKPTDDMFVAGLSLKSWIGTSMPNLVMEVVDSNLVQRHGEQVKNALDHISAIFRVAMSCCTDSPEARINMTDVMAALTKIKTSFTQGVES
ncbi:hypothetical protein VNO77_44460 [Canavalia gladiata]|uniref:non-specific serine/threonine protein kinase n=1 Tax=Canavalia gladiata TaxID=3824 RepID=A0AAN9PR22_CANGL